MKNTSNSIFASEAKQIQEELAKDNRTFYQIGGKNVPVSKISDTIINHMRNIENKFDHSISNTTKGNFYTKGNIKNDLGILRNILKHIESSNTLSTLTDAVALSTTQKYYLAFSSINGNAIVDGMQRLILSSEDSPLDRYNQKREREKMLTNENIHNMAMEMVRDYESVTNGLSNYLIYSKCKYEGRVGGLGVLPTNMICFYLDGGSYEDSSGWEHNVARYKKLLHDRIKEISRNVLLDPSLIDSNYISEFRSRYTQLIESYGISDTVNPVTLSNNIRYTTSQGTPNFSSLITPLELPTDLVAEITDIMSNTVLDNGVLPFERLEKIFKVKEQVVVGIQRSNNLDHADYPGIPFRAERIGFIAYDKDASDILTTLIPFKGDKFISYINPDFEDYIYSSLLPEGRYGFTPSKVTLIDRAQQQLSDLPNVLSVNFSALGNIANEGKETKSVVAEPELTYCLMVFSHLQLVMDSIFAKEGETIPLTLQNFTYIINKYNEELHGHLIEFPEFYNHWLYTNMKGKFEARDVSKPARLFFMEGMLYIFYGLFNHYQKYYDYQTSTALPPFKDRDMTYHQFIEAIGVNEESITMHYSDNLYHASKDHYASLDVSSMEANHTPASSFLITFEIIRNCTVTREAWTLAFQAFIHEYIYGVKFSLTALGDARDRVHVSLPTFIMPSGTCGTFTKNDALTGYFCKMLQIDRVQVINDAGNGLDPGFVEYATRFGLILKLETIMPKNLFPQMKNMEVLPADLLGSSIIKYKDMYFPVLERKRALKAMIFNKNKLGTQPTYYSVIFHNFVNLSIIRSMTDKNVLFYEDLIPLFFNIHYNSHMSITQAIDNLRTDKQGVFSVIDFELNLNQMGLTMDGVLKALREPINKTPITAILEAMDNVDNKPENPVNVVSEYLDKVADSPVTVILQHWLTTSCRNSYELMLTNSLRYHEKLRNAHIIERIKKGLPFTYYTSGDTDASKSAIDEYNEFVKTMPKDKNINVVGAILLITKYFRNGSSYFYSSKAVKDFLNKVLSNVEDTFYRAKNFKLTRYKPLEYKDGKASVKINAPKLLQDNITKEKVIEFGRSLASSINYLASMQKVPTSFKLRVNGEQVTSTNPRIQKALNVLLNIAYGNKTKGKTYSSPFSDLAAMGVNFLDIKFEHYGRKRAVAAPRMLDELTQDEILDVLASDFQPNGKLSVITELEKRYNLRKNLNESQADYIHLLYYLFPSTDIPANVIYRYITGNSNLVKDALLVQILEDNITAKGVMLEENNIINKRYKTMVVPSLSDVEFLVKFSFPTSNQVDKLDLQGFRMKFMTGFLREFPGLVALIDIKHDLELVPATLALNGYQGSYEEITTMIDNLSRTYDRELLLVVMDHGEEVMNSIELNSDVQSVVRTTVLQQASIIKKKKNPASVDPEPVVKIQDIARNVDVSNVITMAKSNELKGPKVDEVIRIKKKVVVPDGNNNVINELDYLPTNITVATTNRPKIDKKKQMSTFKETLATNKAEDIVRKVDLASLNTMLAPLKSDNKLLESFNASKIRKKVVQDTLPSKPIPNPSSLLAPTITIKKKIRHPMPENVDEGVTKNLTKEDLFNTSSKKQEDILERVSPQVVILEGQQGERPKEELFNKSEEYEIVDPDTNQIVGSNMSVSKNQMLELTNLFAMASAKVKLGPNNNASISSSSDYNACLLCLDAMISESDLNSRTIPPKEMFEPSNIQKDKVTRRKFKWGIAKVGLLEFGKIVVASRPTILTIALHINKNCSPINIAVNQVDNHVDLAAYMKSGVYSDSGKEQIKAFAAYKDSGYEQLNDKMNQVLFVGSEIGYATNSGFSDPSLISDFAKSMVKEWDRQKEVKLFNRNSSMILTLSSIRVLFATLNTTSVRWIVPNASKWDQAIARYIGTNISGITVKTSLGRGIFDDLVYLGYLIGDDLPKGVTNVLELESSFQVRLHPNIEDHNSMYTTHLESMLSQYYLGKKHINLQFTSDEDIITTKNTSIKKNDLKNSSCSGDDVVLGSHLKDNPILSKPLKRYRDVDGLNSNHAPTIKTQKRDMSEITKGREETEPALHKMVNFMADNPMITTITAQINDLEIIIKQKPKILGISRNIKSKIVKPPNLDESVSNESFYMNDL